MVDIFHMNLLIIYATMIFLSAVNFNICDDDDDDDDDGDDFP